MKKDRSIKLQYKHMCAQHAKELLSLAKQAGSDPFDYEPGINMLVEFLRYMRDYYKLGYNVWAMERKDEDPKRHKNTLTRYESLERTLAEYDAWQNCYDKYYIHHETGGIANGKGFAYTSIDPKTGKSTSEQSDSWIETLLPDRKENAKAFHKEYLYHKKQFFLLIYKYCSEWWD